MNLRGYQERAHAGIFEAWKKHTSTLAVMATGCGKTVVAAHVIKSIQPGRTMFLAHRNELLVQAKHKFEDVCDLEVEIEKAEMMASTLIKAPIIVGSIQTQISGPAGKRRYTRFDPNDFSLLICDEAHHTASKSWKEVIAYYRQNPNLKVLGLTATPDRADEEALGQIFESVAFEYGILDAIQDGYLVDITQQYVSVGSLDYSHIRTTAGDLNEGDLSRVMEMEENIQGICQPTLEVMFALPPKTLSTVPVPEWRTYLANLNRTPRRTIVFTVSVAQSEMCCNIFSRAMDGVEWVCGKTPKEKRKDTLERFAAGKTHLVANCGVLLEGFDNPGVEVISMGRPTKSRSLYTQAIGRSTRPLPGLVDGVETAEARRAAIAASPKPFCRILDFVGNSGRHKLVSCADVLGGKISEEAVEAAKAKAIKDGKPVKIMVTMSNAEEELARQKRELAEKARQRAEARKAHLLAKSDYHAKDVSPFNTGDSFNGGWSRMSKDGRSFSEKQCHVLRKCGVNPASVGYRQGQAIIGKYYEHPTQPQTKILVKHGYDPKKYTMKEASVLIDSIAANGWKRPEPPKAEYGGEQPF